jgi:hypothetical protein
MGYFSNGTEGLMYQERYCYRCANWRDKDDGRGEGCPIMDLHFLYNTDQLNARGEREGPIGDILQILIPERDGGVFNDECSMFLEAK